MSTEGDSEELRGAEVSLGATLPVRHPARRGADLLDETLPAAAITVRAPERVDVLDNTVDAARGRGELDAGERVGTALTRAALAGPRSRSADLLKETALSRERAPATEEVPAVAGRFKIGRYTVLSELGEGGMGVVYSAFDEELDRRVAIKVVRARAGDDSIGRARMQREAQAMAQLSHPNVVQVHDVGAYAGQVFLAMEYVRGETLTAWQRRLDPREPDDRRRLIDMYIQAGRGLSAAHERGLVHRDFKPDNVLVGEDGRARVLDFGLAASRGEAGGADSARLELVELGRSGHLDADLTRTGAIMGTPAFMAPEQFLARPTDARTDQFSFCVALYGALYGEAPFAGETFSTLRDAVTEGALRDAPDSSYVPSWLRAVVVRGLARRPEQRHEGMDELLAALARDPERARRARRRTLFAFLMVALTSGLALVGGLKAWEGWRHHRHEVDAQARLARLNETLERDMARGASADAERRFIGFVEDPQNRETRALGQAWLRNAERGEARGDANAAVRAYAAAYTVATADEDQIAALVGLARFFREHVRLVSLVRAFALLESRYPDALKTPEQLELKLDTLIARGDFRAAVALLEGPLRASPRAELRSLLEALIPATATAVPPVRGFVPVALDGEGARALLGKLLGVEGEFVVVGVEPSLPKIEFDLGAIKRLPPRVITPWPDAPSRLIVSDSHEQINGRNVSKLLRPRGGALVEEHRWTDAAVLASTVHDLDGDGVDEIYAGTGPFSRHLLELVPSRDGEEVSWSIGHPAVAIDRRASDVLGLVAGDLDEDGRDELVVTLGPWNAYELQVLRRDAGAEQLEMITRHKLGMVSSTRLMRRGEGPPQIAARKIDAYANNVIFPSDRPFGDPPGLYLFRLREGELEQTAFLAEPTLEGDGGYSGASSWSVDLDGDGRDELLSNRRRWLVRTGPRVPIIEVLASLEDGSFERLEIANAEVAGVHDLDGDGDQEVIVTAFGRGDGPGAVWVLGAGADVFPPLPVKTSLADAELPEDSRLATMWRHADELAAMNLTTQAADAFATIADQADAAVAARALINAARLREELSDDEGAAAIYLRAISGAAGTAEATAAVEGAVRCCLRRGDYEGAREAAARGLAPAVSLDAEARARFAGWRAALERLVSGDVSAEYTFDAPLVGWRFDQPLMLARDGATQTLRVDAISTGPLASTPVRWDGGIVEMTVDVDVLRAEWSAGVAIGLVPEGAQDDVEAPMSIGVSVSSWGGSSAQRYALACIVDGSAHRFDELMVDARSDARGVGRFTIRVARDSLLGDRTCRILDADGHELFYHRAALPPGEPPSQAPAESFRLAVHAHRGEAHWAAISLHKIAFRGATRGAPAPALDGRAAIGARMVEGDYAAALAGLAELEGEEHSFEVALWRAVALAELGRTQAAAASLAPFVADDEPPAEVMSSVKEQLRTRFDVFNPVVLEAFGPERYVEIVVDTWLLAHRSRGTDPLPQRALTRGLADLEGRSLSARERLRYTMQRAALYSHAGRKLDARRDRESALALLDDPTLLDDPDDPPSWRAGARARLNFELAADAARLGDLETARALLDDVFSYKELELQFIDLIHARPEFRGVAEDLLSPASPE